MVKLSRPVHLDDLSTSQSYGCLIGEIRILKLSKYPEYKIQVGYEIYVASQDKKL